MLAGGFAFAGMFAYIAATPFVYIELFGVSPQRYGLLFGLNVVGIMTGSFASARLVGRLGVRRLLGPRHGRDRARGPRAHDHHQPGDRRSDRRSSWRCSSTSA